MPDRPVLLLSECHADTALVRFLFHDPKLIIHQTGCPEVAKTMLSPRSSEYKLIGIVDNDKKLNMHCQGFFGQFNLIDQRDNLFIRKHPISLQYLVIIDKAIETFLLWNAAQVDISVQTYGFNDVPKKLGDQLKTPSIETDPDYLRLLTDLYARSAPGFVTLHQLLNDLITT